MHTMIKKNPEMTKAVYLWKILNVFTDKKDKLYRKDN
jgi:hypothetical protein